MLRKPYWDIPIQESHEPLVPLPSPPLVCATPHPYVALGAPYGEVSPFWLRGTVVAALVEAQKALRAVHPHWCLYIFDAYRPVAVQQFMVDTTVATVLQERNLDPVILSEAQKESILAEVYQLWAPPVLDEKTPPPHSTGAAVDLTLFDAQRQETIFMGSPIDELSPRSQPDYFGHLANQPKTPSPERARAQLAHHHRQLLAQVMTQAGFQRHPGEWWHFCLGDQMWAWLNQQQNPQHSGVARYGRITPHSGTASWSSPESQDLSLNSPH
jgi:D-alanyl-D-alanine dipeptidase